MTDTMQGQGQTASTTAPAEDRKKNVAYTLEIMDALPPQPARAGGGGTWSPLQDQVNQARTIITEREAFGKPVLIAKYKQATAATAAANILRKKFGDKAEVMGFTFQTARLTDTETNDAGETIEVPVKGVFLTYDPSKVVEGEVAAWENRKKIREAQNLQARKERDAKAAAEAAGTGIGAQGSVGNGNDGATVAPGTPPADTADTAEAAGAVTNTPAPLNPAENTTATAGSATASAPSDTATAAAVAEKEATTPGNKTGKGADKAADTAASQKR